MFGTHSMCMRAFKSCHQISFVGKSEVPLASILESLQLLCSIVPIERNKFIMTFFSGSRTCILTIRSTNAENWKHLCSYSNRVIRPGCHNSNNLVLAGIGSIKAVTKFSCVASQLQWARHMKIRDTKKQPQVLCLQRSWQCARTLKKK